MSAHVLQGMVAVQAAVTVINDILAELQEEEEDLIDTM